MGYRIDYGTGKRTELRRKPNRSRLPVGIAAGILAGLVLLGAVFGKRSWEPSGGMVQTVFAQLRAGKDLRSAAAAACREILAEANLEIP